MPGFLFIIKIYEKIQNNHHLPGNSRGQREHPVKYQPSPDVDRRGSGFRDVTQLDRFVRGNDRYRRFVADSGAEHDHREPGNHLHFFHGFPLVDAHSHDPEHPGVRDEYERDAVDDPFRVRGVILLHREDEFAVGEDEQCGHGERQDGAKAPDRHIRRLFLEEFYEFEHG